MRSETPVGNGGMNDQDDDQRRVRFDALAREALPLLARYLRRRTDPETADDVLGDTLVVMWRRFDDVEDLPPGSRLPWCYGVARGCLANARRANDRRRGLVRRLAAQPVQRSPSGPHNVPEQHDGELYAALETLSDTDREVLRLWAWEQLEPREIGVALGISANAASIRLHRATERLRGRLGVTRKTHPRAGHVVPRQESETSL